MRLKVDRADERGGRSALDVGVEGRAERDVEVRRAAKFRGRVGGTEDADRGVKVDRRRRGCGKPACEKRVFVRAYKGSLWC